MTGVVAFVRFVKYKRQSRGKIFWVVGSFLSPEEVIELFACRVSNDRYKRAGFRNDIRMA
jgi:hypothetical protein